VKTALYQGVGRIIRGVFSRGRAFLHKQNIRSKLLRGEGGGTIRAILAYWGGVYPLGYGWGAQGIVCPILGIIADESRGVKGAGRGGDTPPRLAATLSGTDCAIEHLFCLVNTPPQYSPIVKKT
jgi:hypothetical protein